MTNTNYAAGQEFEMFNFQNQYLQGDSVKIKIVKVTPKGAKYVYVVDGVELGRPMQVSFSTLDREIATKTFDGSVGFAKQK